MQPYGDSNNVIKKLKYQSQKTIILIYWLYYKNVVLDQYLIAIHVSPLQKLECVIEILKNFHSLEEFENFD